MRHTVVHRNRITPGDHDKRSPSRTDGFSLLESLIALVVFSIGFLALTLLMQTSLKNTNSAFYRSVATEQAYDMADRIRANRGGAGANVVNYLNVEASANPGCIASAAGCTPADLADYDGWHWNQTNARVLPSGGGSIIPDPADAATGAVTVTVSWDDNRTGADCATVPAPADCMSFVVDFIP
jgi:type IV pilus assembly protein PilV